MAVASVEVLPVELGVDELLSEGGISAGGGVGKVEDQGEVEGVGADGEGFVKDGVAADAFEVDSLADELLLQIDGQTGWFPGLFSW
jgi:hypothetical protein